RSSSSPGPLSRRACLRLVRCRFRCGSAASPAHQREADVDDGLLDALTLCAAQEEVCRLLADHVAIDLDRGEARLEIRGEIEIAEADDGDVLGNAYPARAQFIQRPMRAPVR